MTGQTLDGSEIDQRIADAFATTTPSRELALLIRDTKAARDTAETKAEVAREHALDPKLAPREVALARRNMEDASFRRDRLSAAVDRLESNLREAKAREEDAERRKAFDEVKMRRDELVEELSAVYPSVTEQLVDLMRRLQDNDREVEYVNVHARPNGEGRLLVAELVARGLEGFVQGLSTAPRLVQDLQLPAFEYSQHHPFAWPRK